MAVVLDYLPEPTPALYLMFIDKDMPASPVRSFEEIVHLDVETTCSAAERWRGQQVTIVRNTAALGRFLVASNELSCTVSDSKILVLSGYSLFVNLLHPDVRARLKQTLASLRQMPQLDERALKAIDQIAQGLLN